MEVANIILPLEIVCEIAKFLDYGSMIRFNAALKYKIELPDYLFVIGHKDSFGKSVIEINRIRHDINSNGTRTLRYHKRYPYEYIGYNDCVAYVWDGALIVTRNNGYYGMSDNCIPVSSFPRRVQVEMYIDKTRWKGPYFKLG